MTVTRSSFIVDYFPQGVLEYNSHLLNTGGKNSWITLTLRCWRLENIFQHPSNSQGKMSFGVGFLQKCRENDLIFNKWKTIRRSTWPVSEWYRETSSINQQQQNIFQEQTFSFCRWSAKPRRSLKVVWKVNLFTWKQTHVLKDLTVCIFNKYGSHLLVFLLALLLGSSVLPVSGEASSLLSRSLVVEFGIASHPPSLLESERSSPIR